MTRYIQIPETSTIAITTKLAIKTIPHLNNYLLYVAKGITSKGNKAEMFYYDNKTFYIVIHPEIEQVGPTKQMHIVLHETAHWVDLILTNTSNEDSANSFARGFFNRGNRYDRQYYEDNIKKLAQLNIY